MMIFLSYSHNSNAQLIENIKDYLPKDVDGNLKHEVWGDFQSQKMNSIKLYYNE